MTDTPQNPPAPAMSGALDDPKVRAIMRYQQQMAAGDLDAARTVFAPDVVYVVPGRSPLAGTYHGPDEVMGYLGRLLEATDFSYAIDRMHWMVSDDHVALHTHNAATRSGRRFAWTEVIVFAFDAEGRKTRIELSSGDQQGVDDFLA